MMKAIFKHELSLSFHGLAAYVFGAFLLEFIGIGAMFYNINSAIANFEYALGSFCICLVGLVPILTMRVVAEEKKQRTDQLLYLLPVSTTDVVLGKYGALMVVFLVPMVLVGVYPFLFSRYGDVYLPAAYGALVAFLFLGGALVSIGMFISSLTESQGMAAGLSVAAMLLCYYSGSLADYISSSAFNLVALVLIVLLLAQLARWLTKANYVGIAVGAVGLAAMGITWAVDSTKLETLLSDLMNTLSPFERFYTFVNGVFDVTAIVYYLSVTAFFLFLCVQSLEKKRYHG